LADSDVTAELRELRRSIQELTQTVTQQQQEIDRLKSSNPQSKKTDAAAPGVPVGEPASFGGRAGMQAFNPEIGVLADVAAKIGQFSEDAEGNDKLSVRELELIIGHDIDPYSRFDSTIAFSDFEDVALEEAYISHWGLPLELKGKLGRMRPKIGKAAALHRDQLDTVDVPLVVEKYLGAEGLSRTGIK